jgi:hypothetical protein
LDPLTTLDGLNRILTSGTLGVTHDARGNLTRTGTDPTYAFSVDNRLVEVPGLR